MDFDLVAIGVDRAAHAAKYANGFQLEFVELIPAFVVLSLRSSALRLAAMTLYLLWCLPLRKRVGSLKRDGTRLVEERRHSPFIAPSTASPLSVTRVSHMK